MLSFANLKLAVLGHPKSSLTVLSQESSKQVHDLIQRLAEMSSPEEKHLSQVLAKMLRDEPEIDLAALAGLILANRFQKMEDINAVVRNPRYFAFQLANAVFSKASYPFDEKNHFLKLIEAFMGVPLTPQTRERSDSSSSASSLQSVGSVDSVASFNSEREADESASFIKDDLIEEMATKLSLVPESIVMMLLPFYKACVEKDPARKEEAKKNFAGQIFFTFVNTPLHNIFQQITNDDSQKEAKKTKFIEGFKALEQQQMRLLEGLLNRLEVAANNYNEVPLGRESLSRLSDLEKGCREFFNQEITPLLEKLHLLAGLFADFAKESDNAPKRQKLYKDQEKEFKKAKSEFNQKLKEQVERNEPLKFGDLKKLSSEMNVVIGLYANPISFNRFGDDGLAPIHRLAMQMPTTSLAKKLQIERMKLLIDLGVNIKLTTEVFEDNDDNKQKNKGFFRNMFSFVPKMKTSAAKIGLTPKELAIKADNAAVVEILAEAENRLENRGKMQDERPIHPIADSQLDKVFLPPRAPSFRRQENPQTRIVERIPTDHDRDDESDIEDARSDLTGTASIESVNSVTSETAPSALTVSYNKNKSDRAQKTAGATKVTSPRAALRERGKRK